MTHLEKLLEQAKINVTQPDAQDIIMGLMILGQDTTARMSINGGCLLVRPTRNTSMSSECIETLIELTWKLDKQNGRWFYSLGV
jgi:hypothetical protein